MRERAGNASHQTASMKRMSQMLASPETTPSPLPETIAAATINPARILISCLATSHRHQWVFLCVQYTLLSCACSTRFIVTCILIHVSHFLQYTGCLIEAVLHVNNIHVSIFTFHCRLQYRPLGNGNRTNGGICIHLFYTCIQ